MTQQVGFSPLDEAVHLLDTDAEPWTIQFELELSGRLDVDRLAGAVAVATAAHPMSRARRIPARRRDRTWNWEVAEGVEAGAVAVVDPGPEPLDGLREDLYSVQVPLDRSPPLRILVVRRAGGDLVMTSVNHAAFDGIGIERLWTAIARAYRGEGDDQAPVGLTDARNPAVVAAPDGAATRARRLAALVSKGSDLVRSPARLAPDGGGSGRGSGGDGDGYGFVTVDLEPAVGDALLRPEHPPQGVTVNDVLLAAAHLAVAEWNAEHGRPVGRVGVLVPVNLRPSSWRRDVVTNMVLQSRVASGARHRDDPHRLVEEIARQTRRIKAGGGGALADVLSAGAAMPLWAKQPRALLWLTGNRVVDSAQLSNLGEVAVPDFGPDAGEVTAVWFSPPTRMPCAVAIGVATVGGRLCISLRYRRSALGADAAQRFAGSFTRAAGRMVSAGARRPGRRHPRPPRLPRAEVVDVADRGEVFVRRAPVAQSHPGDGAARAPVVLLHGWALSADLNFYSGIYDVAARHGEVIAPDLRGHGRGLRSTETLTLEAAADDVAGLIREMGAAPAVLVGYSMGGSVALLCALRHPDTVAGLVLASTALQWRSSLWERFVWGALGLSEWAIRLGAPEGLTQHYLRRLSRRCPRLLPHVDWMRAEMRRGDPIDIGQAAHGLSGFDERDRVGKIAVPTGVVVTRRDRLVRRRRQLELAAAVPGAFAVEVDGAHSAWLDQPEQFNSALDEALARVVASRAGHYAARH